MAAEKNSFEIGELLIKHENVKLNKLDKRSYAPIHYAARNNSIEMAKLLIEAKANIDKQGMEEYI